MQSQTRRFKFNILDIAIIVAAVCAVAAIVFRAEISDLVGTPKVGEVSLVLSAEGVAPDSVGSLKSGEKVTITFSESSGETPAAVVEVRLNDSAVSSAVTDSSEGEEPSPLRDLGVTVKINGYSRFGVFYTESGEKLVYGSVCEMKWSGGVLKLSVGSAGYVDNTVRQ